MLLATRIFAPEPAAAAFRLRALVAALAQRHDVDVFTVRAAGAERYRPPARVRVRRWPVLRDRAGVVRGYLPYLSFDLPLLLRMMTAKRPDAVIIEPPPTTGLVAGMVCRVRRIPYLWFAADVWSDATESTAAPGFVTGLVRAAERWVLGGAAAVLSVNDQVSERVRQLGARSVSTVGNGIDTDVFCATGPVQAGASTFVYAGTASQWQGADIFARAMPRVLAAAPQARLVYLGQGADWPRLAEIASTLPDGAVSLHDPVPAEQAAAWLRGSAAALVSIVPGQGYDFAVPTKLFAGLGTGTGVIYAGTGPAADLITDNDLGWAVAYDVDAVAAAMIAALQVSAAPGADPAAAASAPAAPGAAAGPAAPVADPRAAGVAADPAAPAFADPAAPAVAKPLGAQGDRDRRAAWTVQHGSLSAAAACAARVVEQVLLR